MNLLNQDGLESFLASAAEPPKALSNDVQRKILQFMSPGVGRCLLKQLALNIVGSLLSLMLCPQFGIELPVNLDFMSIIMKTSPALCFFVCGIVWMIGGQLLSTYLLTWDERLVLASRGWSVGLGFVALSLLVLGCLGSLTFDVWLIFWVMGGISGWLAFTFGMKQKMRGMASGEQLRKLARSEIQNLWP